MNISLTNNYSGRIWRGQKRFKAATEEAFGHIPDDLEVPLLPASRWVCSSNRLVLTWPETMQKKPSSLSMLHTRGLAIGHHDVQV